MCCNSQQDLIGARSRLIVAQRDRVVASYTLFSAVGRLDHMKLALRTPDYDAANPLSAGARRLGRAANAERAVSISQKFGVQTRREDRHRPAVAVVGRVVDKLVVERQSSSAAGKLIA